MYLAKKAFIDEHRLVVFRFVGTLERATAQRIGESARRGLEMDERSCLTRRKRTGFRDTTLEGFATQIRSRLANPRRAADGRSTGMRVRTSPRARHDVAVDGRHTTFNART